MALIERTYTDASDRVVQLAWIEGNGYTVRREDFDGSGTGGTFWYETVDSRTPIEDPERKFAIFNTDDAFTLRLRHELIAVTDTAAPRALTLGPKTKYIGWSCIVKDESGNAGTNNITIASATADIDGAANYVINSDYGSVTLYFNNGNYFTI
jgi:hypothetical protein